MNYWLRKFSILGLTPFLSFLALVLMFLVPMSVQPEQSYDLIIRGGRVLDGSGNPWYYADVAIRGDRIAAVGNLSESKAKQVVDAVGLYVSPGFIDVHSHASKGLSKKDRSQARPLLAQGITTVFVNPDGSGPVDLITQRKVLRKHGLGVNVAQLIGHSSIRKKLIGREDRAPTRGELKEMKNLVQLAMEAGAFGLSSGLFYAPASYAKTKELVELAKVVSFYGGVYASHIRDEADYNIGLVAAVDEVIRIARKAKLSGIVTHIKALGPRVWGFSKTVVRHIERARSEGIEIFVDQYPYEASSTGLNSALLPRWAQAGGKDKLRARFENPKTLARIRKEMLENLERRAGAARIQFRRYKADPSIEGKTLQDIADSWRMDPIDAAIKLLKTDGPKIVSFNMNEEDILTFMRQPWTMTASDGGLPKMNVGVPHPRTYGTFPRKIRKYAMEEKVITLSAAIRSMTSLPSAVFRLKDRGVLREGAYADVVVFDLDRLRDMATYQKPHQLAKGMVHVLVNGVSAIRKGKFTRKLSGRILSRRE